MRVGCWTAPTFRCAMVNSPSATSLSTSFARAPRRMANCGLPSKPAICAKKGQRAINLETQAVNTGYFESQTRFEQVLAPYAPTIMP